MSIVGIVYLVFALFFGLVFLVECIHYRHRVNSFVKYGFMIGLVLVGMDMTFVLMMNPRLLPFAIGVDTGALIRMILFTCVGMYCCTAMNLYDLPGLRRIFHESRPLPPIDIVRAASIIVATVALAVIYSVALFAITKPHFSEYLEKLSETQQAQFGAGNQPSIYTAIICIEFALIEEVTFRLGIQNFLARQFHLRRGKYAVAIVLTTILWSMAHASILNPEWVKFAQVFPLGIALGYIFKRFGLEACILTHAIFNIVMMLIGANLIS